MRTFGIQGLAMASGFAAAMALGSAGSSVAAPAYGNVAIVRAATAGDVIAVDEPGPALAERDNASNARGGGLAAGILPHVASGEPPVGLPIRPPYPPYYGYFEAPYYDFRDYPLYSLLPPAIIVVPRRVYAVRPAYWGVVAPLRCASPPRYVSCAAAWYPY